MIVSKECPALTATTKYPTGRLGGTPCTFGDDVLIPLPSFFGEFVVEIEHLSPLAFSQDMYRGKMDDVLREMAACPFRIHLAALTFFLCCSVRCCARTEVYLFKPR